LAKVAEGVLGEKRISLCVVEEREKNNRSQRPEKKFEKRKNRQAERWTLPIEMYINNSLEWQDLEKE